MAEELQTSTTEADVFDFEAAIDAIDAANEKGTEQETAATGADTAAAPADGNRIRVKYNGEERELAGDELVTAAQKGLNYDKVAEERDAYRKDGAKEALRVEELLAKRYGMSREEYRKFAEDHVAKEQREEELAKVRAESPGISDKLAEELVNARLANITAEMAQKAEAAEAAPWEALAEAYPDIKTAEDVPEQVRKAIGEGKDPLLAMREHELATLKAEIERMKAEGEAKMQNIKNEQRTTGKIGQAQENNAQDDILGILLKGL